MKAKNNRTIVISEEEQNKFLDCLTNKDNSGIFCDDFFEFNNTLQDGIADLIIIDPPYNLYKKYSTSIFSKMENQSYCEYMDSIISKCLRILKPNGTMYICGDWKTSFLQQLVLEEYEKTGQCYVINRITWARDKGKGSKKNWKNNIEDILMIVKDKNHYTFNADSVKIQKIVLAPYKNENGENKDWVDDNDGKHRLTYSSNVWNDITVPFWSMSENTEHPTQKPEKLYAKLILASSNENDLIYEPFCGTGTACIVAKKLGRKWVGVEKEQEYWMLAQKRLKMANNDKTIQGYENGIFKDKK